MSSTTISTSTSVSTAAIKVGTTFAAMAAIVPSPTKMVVFSPPPPRGLSKPARKEQIITGLPGKVVQNQMRTRIPRVVGTHVPIISGLSVQTPRGEPIFFRSAGIPAPVPAAPALIPTRLPTLVKRIAAPTIATALKVKSKAPVLATKAQGLKRVDPREVKASTSPLETRVPLLPKPTLRRRKASGDLKRISEGGIRIVEATRQPTKREALGSIQVNPTVLPLPRAPRGPKVPLAARVAALLPSVKPAQGTETGSHSPVPPSASASPALVPAESSKSASPRGYMRSSLFRTLPFGSKEWLAALTIPVKDLIDQPRVDQATSQDRERNRDLIKENEDLRRELAQARDDLFEAKKQTLLDKRTHLMQQFNNRREVEAACKIREDRLRLKAEEEERKREKADLAWADAVTELGDANCKLVESERHRLEAEKQLGELLETAGEQASMDTMFEEHVSVLEGDITVLREEVCALKEEVASRDQRLEAATLLEAQVPALGQDIGALREETVVLKKEIVALKVKSGNLEGELSTLNLQLEEGEVYYEKLRTDYNSLMTEHRHSLARMRLLESDAVELARGKALAQGGTEEDTTTVTPDIGHSRPLIPRAALPVPPPQGTPPSLVLGLIVDDAFGPNVGEEDPPYVDSDDEWGQEDALEAGLVLDDDECF
jgi:hypothetical protein